MPHIAVPARHATFIDEGRLKGPPTLGRLLRPLEPIAAGVTCKLVMDRFLADADMYALPVVDAQRRPIALVDRRQFVEFFSRPYSHEMFDNHHIAELLAYQWYPGVVPIMIEENCSIDDAATILIDAGVEQMVTGFLICRDGIYAGVANGHDLLNIITLRKQAELYHLAHYDSLTGIPNRMLLADRFGQACLEAARRKRMVALLFIDIDRFKRINDSLGHSAGDAVLCEVVERLKACARRTDTVARLAGDEFVILMEDLAAIVDVDLVARRVVQHMQEPVDLHGHALTVTVSIGSAIYPQDDTDSATLLNKADAAMYHAKATGRNAYCAYSPETALYNPDSLLLVNDLRQAIERGELTLHYQPQVDLASCQVRGVEALLRWQHPRLGQIAPAQFIPAAEESGLAAPLGELVLHQAFGQMQGWRKQGMPPLRMSINLSAHQLYRRGFTELLRTLLQEYGIDPGMLELELTESVLMRQAGEVLQTLDAIKALGVDLAIDDFGTGYSSLSYLRRFPIDRLKIDQSFVHEIDHTPVNQSIARAIVGLARSLALDITAEGIETAAEKDILCELDCDEGQGFLFSPALAPEALPAWLTLHRIRHCTKGAGEVARADG